VAARTHGATVVRYAHDGPEALERLLHRHPKAPRLVCMDGINSMTGNPPDLPAFLALARANDALLYVDDAHGFGVVGERDREEISPYGRRGNGVVRPTWARATTTWCSPAASPGPTPRCWPSSPARPSSSACSRSPPPVPVLGPVPGGLAGPLAGLALAEVGQGYPAACEAAAAAGYDGLQPAATGVRAVLAGEVSLFRCRYHAPGGAGPYEVTVAPFADGDGAVVTHRPPAPTAANPTRR
jgi:aminotransferase class I and II